jgi:uracil-DNA glycosylase
MTRRSNPSVGDALSTQINICQRCEELSRTVFALGPERQKHAELIFISAGGENSPQALALLDRMIEAMGLRRDQVYLCDVTASHAPHPDGARDSREFKDVGFCLPFLAEKLETMQPRAIVALGQLAAQTLLESAASLPELRGRFHEYHGSKLMPTFHPAELLLHPELKRETWSDLQNVASELGIRIPRK